jgi:hypothetical protein
MPKGPRKLVITFGNQTLTHYGGVYLLHRFLTRIGLKNAIATEIRFIQRNNRYTVGELLLAILYPIILGLERIETTQLLQHNGVFRYLSGLPTYPDPSTLRRFLLRIAPQALTRLRKLHDRLLAKMIAKPHLPSRVIFDLDSTVLVVYGKQQGAEVGYNPTKRGRRSYHPLLCFEGRTKDFWHGELRPGNVHTASGTLDLLKACFAKIPSEIKSVIIRADKGFYDRRIVEWLEECKARFVIVARLTRPIKRKLAHLKYVSVSTGVQTAEFYYQPLHWFHPYRFVVIRRPQPEESEPQLTLFKLGRYHYQILVTNLDLKPVNLWRFYNGRAGIERIIRELKGDYPLGKIPTRHFFANDAYFHLLLLAYNLVNWFKRLCLPREFQTATLNTLRNRILLMPALLLRTGNRPRLAMPAGGPRENAWKHALHKIEKLRL